MNKVQRVKLVLSVSLTSLFVAASYELRNALASLSSGYNILSFFISFFLGTYFSSMLVSAIFKLKVVRRLILGKSWIEGFWYLKTYHQQNTQGNSLSHQAILYTDYEGDNLNLRVVTYRAIHGDQTIYSRSELVVLRESDSLYLNYSLIAQGTNEIQGVAIGRFFNDGTTKYPNRYEGKVITFADGLYQRQTLERIDDVVIMQYKKKFNNNWQEFLLKEKYSTESTPPQSTITSATSNQKSKKKNIN